MKLPAGIQENSIPMLFFIVSPAFSPSLLSIESSELLSSLMGTIPPRLPSSELHIPSTCLAPIHPRNGRRWQKYTRLAPL